MESFQLQRIRPARLHPLQRGHGPLHLLAGGRRSFFQPQYGGGDSAMPGLYSPSHTIGHKSWLPAADV